MSSSGFDRDFIFTMVEMLFGGDGSEPPVDDERNYSSDRDAHRRDPA